MSLEPHMRMVQWIKDSQGSLHRDVEIVFDAEKGYYAKVSPGSVVKSGSSVAKCSMATSLSVLNAIRAPPFSSHGTRLPTGFLLYQKFSVVQSFFLMEQWVLKDRSWWAPYLATLPKPDVMHDVFFTDNEADLSAFKGTRLETAISKQIEGWKAEFTEGLDLLKRLGWVNATNNTYTWELYHWACVIFGSRSFTSQVLSNTLPADKARPMGCRDPDHGILSSLFEDGFAVLLPLLDIFNHRPLSQVEWRAGLNDVSLQVLRPVEGGQEVCNNYGPRDNEALILGYGFSMPANPFDFHAVGIKVPLESPLADARTRRAKADKSTNMNYKAEDDYQHYIFHVDHPRAKHAEYLETAMFSRDLFDSLSILSGNIRELRSPRFLTTGSVINLGSKQPPGWKYHRNMLQTICQIRAECRSRSSVIRANEAKRKEAPSQMAIRKQHYAKLYRDNQLLILDTAALLCRYCLLKAQVSPLEEIDHILSGAADVENLQSPEVTSSVRQFVRRSPSSIKTRTLFSFTTAVSLVPNDLAAKIMHVRQDIGAAMGNKMLELFVPGTTTAKDIEARIGFAILLAVMRHMYAERMNLPGRLYQWMRRLSTWYSFDDATFSSPTEESLPLMDALTEAFDLVDQEKDEGKDETHLALSDPSMICWGWNVQEEEGVLVDAEPRGEQSASPHSRYLLCIPATLESDRLPN